MKFFFCCGGDDSDSEKENLIPASRTPYEPIRNDRSVPPTGATSQAPTRSEPPVIAVPAEEADLLDSPTNSQRNAATASQVGTSRSSGEDLLGEVTHSERGAVTASEVGSDGEDLLDSPTNSQRAAASQASSSPRGLGLFDASGSSPVVVPLVPLLPLESLPHRSIF